MTTLVIEQLPATVARSTHTSEGHLGDTSYYSAQLTTADGKPHGVILGHLETVRAHDHAWDRVGTAVFQFNESDTIVVVGAVTYPPGTLHSRDGAPFLRAVVGGTGAHIGARGQVSSVRSPGGAFTHTFTLV